jgi:aerobic carbon-monoxide dehydrogenase medium subunit
MYPAAFKYAAPRSIADAVALLQAGAGEAKVIAGGHSLLPLMKLRLAQPSVLVDITRIDGLRYIREDREAGWLRIGALTRHVDIDRSEVIRAGYPLLHDAAGGIGDPQVRNRGTLAGSLAHGDPASDWPAVVLATGGEVVAIGPNGERVIPVRQLVVDTFQTDLSGDEIVTEVRIPLAVSNSGGAYEKLERKVGDYAVVGVAAQLALDAQGDIVSIGLGLCNVGPTSLRAEAAEEFLRGKPPAPDNVNEAARLAMEASQPVTDDRGPEDYKRGMVKELTKRALSRALSRAKGGVA